MSYIAGGSDADVPARDICLSLLICISLRPEDDNQHFNCEEFAAGGTRSWVHAAGDKQDKMATTSSCRQTREFWSGEIWGLLKLFKISKTVSWFRFCKWSKPISILVDYQKYQKTFFLNVDKKLSFDTIIL